MTSRYPKPTTSHPPIKHRGPYRHWSPAAAAQPLDNASGRGDAWIASCPNPNHGKGNGDRNPSLSITRASDGGPAFKCHAGCPSEAVWQAYHTKVQGGPLREEEFHPLKSHTKGRVAPTPPPPSQSPTPPPRILEVSPGSLNYDHKREWPYLHESGEDRWVYRKPCDGEKGKQIWQSGGSLKGTYTLFFQPPHEPLWHGVCLVEGEKAAEHAAEAGYRSASFIGGASSVHNTNPIHLMGEHIVIFPDWDIQGIAAARKMEGMLRAIAASVRVVPVREDGYGKDVADMPLEERRQYILEAINNLPVATQTTQVAVLPPQDKPSKSIPLHFVDIIDQYFWAYCLEGRFILDKRVGVLRRREPEGWWAPVEINKLHAASTSADFRKYLKKDLAPQRPADLQMMRDIDSYFKGGFYLNAQRRQYVEDNYDDHIAAELPAMPDWVLNFQDRVLDMKTGLCRARTEDDHFLHCFDYPAPELWASLISPTRADQAARDARFLERIMLQNFKGDRDVLAYFLRLLGGAVSRMESRSIMHMVGGPGTGKSMMANMIKEAFWAITVSLKLQDVASTKNLAATSGPVMKALITDARLVAYPADPGPKPGLSHREMKTFSGNDYAMARDIYRRDVEAKVKATPYIHSNYLPKDILDITDEGFLRRCKVIVFPHSHEYGIHREKPQGKPGGEEEETPLQGYKYFGENTLSTAMERVTFRQALVALAVTGVQDRLARFEGRLGPMPAQLKKWVWEFERESDRIMVALEKHLDKDAHYALREIEELLMDATDEKCPQGAIQYRMKRLGWKSMQKKWDGAQSNTRRWVKTGHRHDPEAPEAMPSEEGETEDLNEDLEVQGTLHIEN